MALFVYPRKKKTRTLSPPQYTNYRHYKPHLQVEFQRTCVYCRRIDSLLLYDSFGVDHYKPKRKFPALENIYSNLFYACNACNRRKGDFWPNREQLKAKLFVPNCCDHSMAYHMRVEPDSIVKGLTPTGSFTVELLQLNDPEHRRFRESISYLLSTTKIREKEIKETIKETKKIIRNSRTTSRSDLEKDLDTLNAELQKIERIKGNILGL